MRKVKITTIILAIILITLVAFGGVYIKTQNRMENKVKDYTLDRELKGGRTIELKVVTEKPEGEQTIKTNPETLTVENYETVKKTIEERLKSFGAQDYTISLNREDGTIRVELPEDGNVDIYAYLLTASVKVQMKEKDTNTELLSDDMIQNAKYTYTADMEGAYEVFLQLELTKEGQAKIEEIKNNYAVFAEEISEIEVAKEAEKKEAEKKETTEETATEAQTENKSEENKEETKKIALLTIDGSEYDIKKIEKNKIQLLIGGKTTNTASVNNNMNSAAEIAILISSGKMPLEYEIQDNTFIYTDITNKQILYFGIAVAIVMLIVFVIAIIKYKTKGLLASISCIGFASILLLLLRYTNVNISIEGLGGIILIFIINFRVNQIMIEKNLEIDYKDLILKLAPVLIIALVFCFASWLSLSSFGMVMFWGLALIAVYNATVTKTLLKLKESK